MIVNITDEYRYLELATKLLDKAFLQKFRANNFERRLLKDLGKQNDEVP